MFFLSRDFVSGLICTLKSKKPKKRFPKNLGFFQRWEQLFRAEYQWPIFLLCKYDFSRVNDRLFLSMFRCCYLVDRTVTKGITYYCYLALV